jgi:hypothetical protein
MSALDAKKALILARESRFADAVGAAVFVKPRVSVWMVLLPILFVFFAYRMQQYKQGRRKFASDFMLTRRRALDAACRAVAAGSAVDVENLVRQAALPAELEPAYRDWVSVQAELYRELLIADGRQFEELARSISTSRGAFLLHLNRLSAAEKGFYDALQRSGKVPRTGDAADIIVTIETRSRQLRRELAEQVFP